MVRHMVVYRYYAHVWSPLDGTFKLLLPQGGGGRSNELTPITSTQIQNATESGGDKFKIDDRELSQVTIM